MNALKLIAVAGLASACFAFATPALATPSGDPPGCAVGQHGDVDNDPTGHGCPGQGGNGGNGGNGGGGGQGGGGGNANNAVTTTATATATGGNAQQQQGQLQGQLQGQQQSATSAVSGSGNSTNDNTSSAASTGNTTAVTVEGDKVTYQQRRIPVATAYAPFATSGADTCTIGTSAGVQSSVFGLSFGSGRHDKVCESLKLSRELKAQGYGLEACTLLVNEDRRVAAAFRASGRTCAATVAVTEVVQPQPYVAPVLPTQPVPVQPPFTGERGN